MGFSLIENSKGGAEKMEKNVQQTINIEDTVDSNADLNSENWVEEKNLMGQRLSVQSRQPL